MSDILLLLDAEFLQVKYFGNTLLEWLTAMAFALLAAFALHVAKWLVVRQLGKIARKAWFRAGEVLVETAAATRWYSYIAVALYVGALYVQLPADASRVLDATLMIALLVQLGTWTRVLVSALVHRWFLRRGDGQSSTVAAGIVFVARLVIWAGVALMILSNLGVEITAVVAGLGVGGVAAALAVQGVLGDLFASLSIYLDRPFDIGDFIIVGEFLGTVERIGLRTTRIASLGGEQIIFSNADLVKSRIRNYARMKERRVAFGFGIEYNLPAAKLEEAAAIAREVIDQTSDVRLDRVHFKAYGDYSLQYEAVYYVNSSDYTLYMQRQHEINLGIYRRFEDAGIPFAFPTRTLHIRRERGEKTSSAAGPHE